MAPVLADAPRRERLQTLAHYLTAFVLALEGVARLGEPHRVWSFILLTWSCAAVVLVLTRFHRSLRRLFPSLQPVLHSVESVVCGALFLLTRHEGKHALPFAWLAAAVLLAAVAVFQFRRRAIVAPEEHRGS